MQQPVATPAPAFGYGDCITWPFRSGEWIAQIVLMSLIGLIPFVGGMALAGWVLTAADNLHEGVATVPRAGFYLHRGARLYFVAFVWGLIASAILYGGMFAFFAVFFHPSALPGGAYFFAFGGWFAFVLFLGVATHVAFLFIVPGAVEADERGALRGLNPIPAIADVFRHPKDSLLAALIAYLAWIIAGLGASLCYVGFILTLGYGAMVFAGALYVYERNTKISAAQ
ncbi:MAG TPA: DUF4013 domain-containing protein [Candidatus Dormibacteraeota bacterium]|nr:DUF4013 domain-containing protein [Candidatus Dormibacteraeota bacterium]